MIDRMPRAPVVGQRQNGTVLPIELSVPETRVGNEISCSGTVRNRSQRERALADRSEPRRLLHQRGRLADIGAMTARLVHDFGNPLVGLLMTAQQMLLLIEQDGAQPAEHLRPHAERLLAVGRQLDAMVHDFKDFTREQPLTLQPVALAPFLEEVVNAWRPEADNRNVALRIDLVGDLTIHIDRFKCRRVFDNLLKNALEAVDHGPGEVRIRAAQHTDTQMRISIADSGPGIPSGLDVFALFESTKPAGTGLGLPICKQIVFAHGGTLDFAAIVPHGTVFHVDLPIGSPRFEDVA